MIDLPIGGWEGLFLCRASCFCGNYNSGIFMLLWQANDAACCFHAIVTSLIINTGSWLNVSCLASTFLSLL